jgi:hypothetical protein
MKKALATLFVGAVVGTGAILVGCSQEVAHSEKDSPTLTGGQKHEQTTTYRNPDGSYTTEHSATKSNP